MPRPIAMARDDKDVTTRTPPAVPSSLPNNVSRTLGQSVCRPSRTMVNSGRIKPTTNIEPGISVGSSNISVTNAVAFYARDRKFFEAEGFDVQMIIIKTEAALAALTAGDLDYSTLSTSSIEGTLNALGMGVTPYLALYAMAVLGMLTFVMAWNEFFWPIMHDMPEYATYKPVDHKFYRTFNTVYALHLSAAARWWSIR